MIPKLIRLVLLVFVFMSIHVIAQSNTNPAVTNVAFSISGTTVTVTYDVTDAEQDAFTIIMLVSSDGGSTWGYNYGTATGAIGAGVTEGTNKTITWEYTGGYNPDFKVRIYANDETADGSPCPGLATVDYGGKTYHTIQIGTQCWLKENLDVGTRINGSQNQTNNSPTNFIEKYCYNNLDANCVTYGGLYQWNEAMQYVTNEGAQGICPTGWHIPTRAQHIVLNNAVGSNSNALKAVGQGWGSKNTSGFSALMAGLWRYFGFDDLNLYTRFWSSTEFDEWCARYIRLDAGDGDIDFLTVDKEYGFSIRCIKDIVVQPDAPTLLNPSNGATNIIIPPTLSWNASAGAVSYRLQVSTSDQFTTTVYDSSNITGTSHQVLGLSYSTTYYWRVNATNSYGTSEWSSIWSFTSLTANVSCPGIPTITYSGKTYNTVLIGDLCWLKENLDVGTKINGSQNQTNNGMIEKYCYDDLDANCATYGGLYKWYEAMQYVTIQGARGICPSGWHIPTYAQLQALGDAVGGNGNALKAIGQGTGSGAGTNNSGFSALLAGYWLANGSFYSLGYYAFFWSSSEEQSSRNALWMWLGGFNSSINFHYYDFDDYAFSVRCLKD